MYCYACGLRLPDGARFCARCGRRQVKEAGVVPSNVAAPLSRPTCPHCRQAVDGDVCARCGHPLDSAAAERQVGRSLTVLASLMGCGGCLGLVATIATVLALAIPNLRQQALESAHARGGEPPEGWALALVLGVLAGATALVLLTALGLWARRRWARPLGLVISSLALLGALSTLVNSCAASDDADTTSTRLGALLVGGLAAWAIVTLARQATRLALTEESR